MAYGHAERNLALLRQLEAETRQLLESLDQPDPEQSAWLQEVTSGGDGRRSTSHAKEVHADESEGRPCPGCHDPAAGPGGAPPGRSALTLRR